MTPGFRNVGAGVLFRRRGYAVGEREISVGYRVGREGLEAEILPEGVSSLALVSRQADRVELRTLPRFVDPSAQAPEGALVAPAAGSVTEVMVTVGQQVEQGAILAVVENVSEEDAA